MQAKNAPLDCTPAAAILQCVACGGAIENQVEVRISRGELRRCASCGSWTCFPRIEQSDQSGLHDTAEYYEHPYFQLRRVLSGAQLRRWRGIFERLAGVIDVSGFRGKRLLDVGCDTGVFLKAAQQLYGIVPCGVDVSHRSIASAAKENIETYCGTLESAPPAFAEFSIITAIDLIEHVTEPDVLLKEIGKRLAPGGVAYLETPNIESAVYGIGRALWNISGGRPASLYERLFPAQHIQYFTRDGLTRLVASSGLELVRMGDRRLPASDIAASLATRAAMSMMQAIDALTANRILLWTIVRRP
jgi:2-polyprenyl-3-methyl-5-hydroxy-6-metoxy-1,4-benzoquinol methylase